MVELRVERREVCFRIAFLGRVGATKFANIRRLHEAIVDRGPEDLTVMHVGGDRVVGFRLFDEDAEPIDELRVGFQCVTMPGEATHVATERLLAASADAVVWLDDREGADETAPAALRSTLETLDRDFVDGEDEAWPRPIIVQCYADDGEDRAGAYREVLASHAARIRRIASDDAGLASIFDEARERVLEVYRLEAARGGRKRRRWADGSRPGRRLRTPSGGRRGATRRFLGRVIGLRSELSAGREALRRAELALFGALLALGLAGVALLVSLTL